MTRDEIIRMAREADIIDFRDADDDPHTAQMVEFLARFATLVAADEREACAKVCDTFKSKTLGAQSGPDNELANLILRQVAHLGHAECASAIRARSMP